MGNISPLIVLSIDTFSLIALNDFYHFYNYHVSFAMRTNILTIVTKNIMAICKLFTYLSTRREYS